MELEAFEKPNVMVSQNHNEVKPIRKDEAVDFGIGWKEIKKGKKE